MNQILLAYCHENADLAHHIQSRLGRLGLPFEHVHDSEDQPHGTFAERLRTTDDGVILLITDNFLRSRACMSGALRALQRLMREQTLLAVVADGSRMSDNGTRREPVETHIDRMVHALQYMNFWQSVWLDHSNRFEHTPEHERGALRTEMQEVHDIANEMGEFIAALREAGYVTWEQLERNDFAVFFRTFGLQDWHQQYRELTKMPDYSLPPLESDRSDRPLAPTPTLTGPLAPVGQFPTAPPAAAAVPPSEPGTPDEPWQTDDADADTADQPPAADAAIPHLPPAHLERELAEETGVEPPAVVEENQETPAAVDDAEIENTIRDAWFWLENGHSSRGFALFELALEQFPDHPFLREQYALAQARHGAEAAVPAGDTPPFTPPLNQEPTVIDNPELQTYLTMGEEAVDKGDYLFAKFCWDRVAELNPTFPGIFHKLGVLTSEHLRDYKETAVYYLRRALEQDPRDVQAHFQLARVQREQFGDEPSAIYHLEQVIEIDPQHATAWFELAQIALQHGRREDAADFYQRAAAIDPALRTASHDQIFAPTPGLPEHTTVPETEASEADAGFAGEPVNTEQIWDEPLHATAVTTDEEDSATLYPWDTNTPAPAAPWEAPATPDLSETEPAATAEETLTPAYTGAPADADTSETASQPESVTEGELAGVPSPHSEPAEENETTPGVELDDLTVDDHEQLGESPGAEPPGAEALTAEVVDTDAVTGSGEGAFSTPPLTESETAAAMGVGALTTASNEQTEEETITEETPAGIEVPAYEAPDAVGAEPPAGQLEAAVEAGGADAAKPQPPRGAETLTVLITGATSGIGRATAELFARHGHRLILTGRRGDRLEDVRAELEATFNTDVLTLEFDVRDPDAVRAALDGRDERWQDVDILINNAGLAKGLSFIHEGDLEHWTTMIDTNIKGLLFVTRAVTPHMVERGRGHIINVGSVAGKEVYPKGNVYCATKFAVDALTQGMRLDLHNHGIRVSQVAPGHVEDTEFAITRYDGDGDRAARTYDHFEPLKAADVADVIYFMATRPAHVNIQDVVLYSTQQASTTVIDRSGRSKTGL